MMGDGPNDEPDDVPLEEWIRATNRRLKMHDDAILLALFLGAGAMAIGLFGLFRPRPIRIDAVWT
jgi:hypothetical protein